MSAVWQVMLIVAYISNSCATGSVSGTGNVVGGLVGESNGSISNSYATGLVTGAGENVGGLVGSVASNSVVRNSYYTGRNNGVGMFRMLVQLQCPEASGADCSGAVTYEGWDPQIWDFGLDIELPKFGVTQVVDAQGRLRIRVYLGGAAR